MTKEALRGLVADAQRMSWMLKGKSEAFAEIADVLGKELQKVEAPPPPGPVDVPPAGTAE